VAAGESEAAFRQARELTVMLLQIGRPFALESLKAFLAGDGRASSNRRELTSSTNPDDSGSIRRQEAKPPFHCGRSRAQRVTRVGAHSKLTICGR
jgi:hypothetical protein